MARKLTKAECETLEKTSAADLIASRDAALARNDIDTARNCARELHRREHGIAPLSRSAK